MKIKTVPFKDGIKMNGEFIPIIWTELDDKHHSYKYNWQGILQYHHTKYPVSYPMTFIYGRNKMQVQLKICRILKQYYKERG